MRAAVYYGNHNLEIEDVPEPTPGDGQVKVQVSRNGICGTDLHEYYDGPIFIPPTEPHPLTGKAMPLVIGHEFSGAVTDVGAGVTDVDEGDRVTIEPIYRCGALPAVQVGPLQPVHLVGFHGLMADGGMAEYTVVPRNQVHKLPDSVPLEMGALVEPMSVAYHAAVLGGGQRPEPRADLRRRADRHRALVRAARHGPDRDRRRRALRDPTRSRSRRWAREPSTRPAVDVPALIADRTDGNGVDAAFDAAGVAASGRVGAGLRRRAPPADQRRHLRQAAQHAAHQPRPARAPHPGHDLLHERRLPRRHRPHGPRPLRHHRLGRHHPAHRRRRAGLPRAARRPPDEAARRPDALSHPLANPCVDRVRGNAPSQP